MNGQKPVTLNLQVEEIENRSRPGCQNSSSTNPLCTCPIRTDVKG